jgi:hypothetical protein
MAQRTSDETQRKRPSLWKHWDRSGPTLALIWLSPSGSGGGKWSCVGDRLKCPRKLEIREGWINGMSDWKIRWLLEGVRVT